MHTYESPELGEVKKDPRDTLIEAQREYIKFLEDQFEVITPLDDPEYVREYADHKSQIEAAEKAIKGG